MTTNPSPEFAAAQKQYLIAETPEEKLLALEKMISTAPAHKGGENLRANLRTRYKKLQESLEKSKKAGKGKKGIKKEIMQAIILGFPNSGKSSVFAALTGVNKNISENAFSTTREELGTLKYADCNIQIIDMPPFPNSDKSIINSADVILLVVDKIEDIKNSEQYLLKSTAKTIIVFTKTDLLNEEQKRKINSYLQSKKYNYSLFSYFDQENLEQLKLKLFTLFPIIRIYLKEPKKPASNIPMILPMSSSLKDVAEKILKGLSKKIKKARIWGPSSKFSGQIIGLDHLLKDKDIVEFQTE